MKKVCEKKGMDRKTRRKMTLKDTEALVRFKAVMQSLEADLSMVVDGRL